MNLGQNENIKDDLKKLYDEKAEEYGKSYATLAGHHFMWRKINTARQMGSFEKGMNILEVGSANGSYTFEFAKMGFTMTGIDLSEKCIESATKKAQESGLHNINFVNADAENLSLFPDNTFDGVLSFSTLRYVPDAQKAVKEIFRVVKHDRTVVLDFPNKFSPWFNYIKPWITGKKHIYDHHYSTGEVKAFFHNAGFHHIRVKRILYMPKFAGKTLFTFLKYAEKIGELPLLNNFASIIMCYGIKP